MLKLTPDRETCQSTPNSTNLGIIGVKIKNYKKLELQEST